MSFEDTRKRLVVAIQHRMTGVIHKGGRNEWHLDIFSKLGLAKSARWDFEFGYYDPLNNSFLKKDDYGDSVRVVAVAPQPFISRGA